jgi:hypothetical protein
MEWLELAQICRPSRGKYNCDASGRSLCLLRGALLYVPALDTLSDFVWLASIWSCMAVRASCMRATCTFAFPHAAAGPWGQVDA